MNFILWHFTEGVPLYIKRWGLSFRKIVHFFALPVLVRTLFAPWKRLTVETGTVFNFTKFFEQLTFNTISRAIGAVVRFFLIVFCLIVLIGDAFFGLVLMFIWVPFFPLSLPDYLKYKNSRARFIENLLYKMKNRPGSAVNAIFQNSAGQFLLSHLGEDINPIIAGLKIDPQALSKLSAESYEDIIKWLIGINPDFETKLQPLSLTKEDLFLAASCWDYRKNFLNNGRSSVLSFDHPGVGSELLTGYTPGLDNYSEDYNYMPSFSSHLVGRKDVVMRMARVLQTGKSVILVGQPGVGKKTVVHEFVHRAWKGELDSSLSYSRVLDLNYQAILSGSSDLYQKKVKLSELINEASRAGNVILVIKDLQRLTSSQVEGTDFTDVIEKALEPGKLKIIAIVSTVDYERFLAKDARISKYFEPIEVIAPNRDEALSVLIAFAQRLEIEKRIIITAPALRRVLEGSDKYITDTPFPEKTLELLEEVTIAKTDATPISVDDVNRILTEKTGISLVRLTGESQTKLSRLEEIIHEHLIDQENAVSLIAKSLRGRTLGGKSEDRPVGSFLFLGPTGVGKTQTAKVLADVYFGDEKSIIRFDFSFCCQQAPDTTYYLGNHGYFTCGGSIFNHYDNSGAKKNPCAVCA